MSSKAIIDYTMEDDSLGVRDALYSAIQDRVMAHIEAKKAEIASNFITQQEEVEEDEEYEDEEYVNIPEGVEVFVPTNSINEASKEEHPWRMDKDRKGTGYHIVNSVRPKTAKVNGVNKTIGLESDGVHSHAFESHHEAEKCCYDLAERGHTCTHHCPQGYVKAVVQPSHGFEI